MCFLPQTGFAANDPAKIRAIVDAAVHPIMSEHGVPGMAVAVTVDGQAYFFNYGVASRENKTPVSEATLFELGSISKILTATLASYAQVVGKLSLGDRPGKYMPQLEGSAIDKASLLNLGTYTAGGLPLQFPEHVSNDRMSAYFRQWTPAAEPGTQRTYSNPSLGLFGHLAALALKTEFVVAIEEQLLPQLGMTHSYIHVPKSAMANYAWGYDEHNKPVRMNPGVFAAEAYGIKSTSADMIGFVQANIAPSRLESPIRRAVEGTHVGYFKVGNMVQGLGWEQYSYPITLKQLLAGNSYAIIREANAAKRVVASPTRSAPTLFNKTGSTGGFHGPENKIGIVMLANKNYPIPARIKAAHSILVQLTQASR